MNLVKYTCGCVGFIPDKDGVSLILEPCEEPAAGKGLAPIEKNFGEDIVDGEVVKHDTITYEPVSPAVQRIYWEQLKDMCREARAFQAITAAIAEGNRR